MKILLISDRISPSLYDHFHPDTVAGVEMVISCGDLPAHYLEFIVSTLNVPCYFVPGNHDSYVEKKPPPGWTSIDGKCITSQGIAMVGLGGSMRYKDGPFQYSEMEMRARWLRMQPSFWLRKKRLDILVTHAPAYQLGDLDNTTHRGYKVFRKIISTHGPRYHFHGHVHLNYSTHPRILQHQSTQIVNGFQHHLIDFC